MSVLAFGDRSLAALVVVVAGVLVAMLIVSRIIRADRTVRIARLGVFVERQRVADAPPLEADELGDDTLELERWPARDDDA